MALVVTSAASFAQSDGDCVSCGGDPVFPEAAEFLAAKGYPPEDFVVLLTWNEVPRNGDGGLVTGYRLAPSRGGEPLDVYSDADGALLDDDRMAALGIRAKNWDLAPVSKETELPRSVAKALAARPVPKCIKWNTAVSGSISLPPIDLELVRLEDALGESTPGKGAKRIGVFQELSDPVVVVGDSATVGTWRRVDGGAIWSASIHSPNAVGQRIHFSGLSLPHAAEVVVYDANDPDEAYGPYLALGDDAGLWSATCFSDEAVVECYVPRTADVDDVLLEIDRTVHLYINPGSLPWQKAAGSCNLDVVCYPDWTTTARGIGGIGLIGDSGYLWCTGTLIADTNTETSIPYFLTADHCVDRQDKARAASSIEVYWLFQTDSCGGTVPDPATVSRSTGGADYLASSPYTAGTDFALLRLRGSPPEDITFVGWVYTPVLVGEEVTCIHHPSGDYKRISFGTITDRAERAQPAERYHEVIWHDGTTEPGSSGSPLMLTDTEQIIGQLYGGTASCSLPLEPDYYGRFDVTFPLVQQWLAPESTAEDLDADGIPNADEEPGDWDGDGILNYLDTDSDNDGILDIEEGITDIDADGAPNYLDLESDGDGFWDEFEIDHGTEPRNAASYPSSGLFGDVNVDGVVDSQDVDLVIDGAFGAVLPMPVDMDHSGQIDAVDVEHVIEALVDCR